MRIRVLAFAGLRELLDATDRGLELSEGARVSDVWFALVSRRPELDQQRGSTRVARNGRLVSFDEALGDGDEIALLPPVGGG
jgi:molybdopterin converting factor small subunit